MGFRDVQRRERGARAATDGRAGHGDRLPRASGALPHGSPWLDSSGQRLRRKKLTVSWDFGWSGALAQHDGLAGLMDALDLVFLNELEAPLYAHVNDLDDAYAPLRARACAVIVKLGALGSRWLRKGGDVVMPAPRVDALDTTGAGDAFNAGFLCAWMRGAQPATCLATGNAVGAASTRAAGGLDALPMASDLPAMLRPENVAKRKRPRLGPPARRVPRPRRVAPAQPARLGGPVKSPSSAAPACACRCWWAGSPAPP